MECQVCNEIGSAKPHYGSHCCNGCKNFFRRCIRERRVYRCRGSQQCEVTKESRKRCGACRLAKCLKAGLNPGLLHSDRTLNSVSTLSRQKSTLSYETTESGSIFEKEEKEGDRSKTAGVTPGIGHMDDEACSSDQKALPVTNMLQQQQHLEAHACHDNRIMLASSRKALEVSNSLALGCISGLLQSYRTAKNCTGGGGGKFFSAARYFATVERFCEDYSDTTTYGERGQEVLYLLNIPVEEAFIRPRFLSARTSADWRTLAHVTNEITPWVWCRALVYYADWASHIPELSQLDSDDLVTLLSRRTTCCVWAWFGSCSIRRACGSAILFADGSYFPRDAAEQRRTPAGMCHYFQAVSNRFFDEFIQPVMDMSVTEGELALLRVLCLCEPVMGLKPAARKHIMDAKMHYQAELAAEVRQGLAEKRSSEPLDRRKEGVGVVESPNFTDTCTLARAAMERLGKLLSLVAVVERVGITVDNQMALVTLFNVACMKGSLPYEIHVRNKL